MVGAHSIDKNAGESRHVGRRPLTELDLPPPLFLTLICQYPVISASYPDVSLSMEMCAKRKAGRRQRGDGASPSVRTLPMVPCGSSPVPRLCYLAKNEAPKEEAAVISCSRVM